MVRSIVSVVVVGAVLTGCGFDSLSMLRDQKIADLMSVGMTKQQVIAEWGEPIDTIDTMNSRGVCFDYKRRLSNGNTIPVYVGFRNSDNRVVANGVSITCRQALDAGHLNTLELPKQRY